MASQLVQPIKGNDWQYQTKSGRVGVNRRPAMDGNPERWLVFWLTIHGWPTATPCDTFAEAEALALRIEERQTAHVPA